jgi:hypothetical protein
MHRSSGIFLVHHRHRFSLPDGQTSRHALFGARRFFAFSIQSVSPPSRKRLFCIRHFDVILPKDPQSHEFARRIFAIAVVLAVE